MRAPGCFVALGGLSCALVSGCAGEVVESQSGPTESLFVALSYSESDVTAVRFDVVRAEDSCEATPIASETIALTSSEENPLEGHAFASTLLLLPPGTYRVCATPLAGETNSADCAPVDAISSVTPEATSELMLVSQCKGDPAGGVSPIVTLNKPPRVQKLTLSPSKVITVCETLKMSATATDPEGDALTFAWSVLAGSPDARLRGDGEAATFSGPAGSYLLQLRVTDIHAGKTSLSFAVRVVEATCSVPRKVHDIFLTKCTPCHTSSMPAAGMSLLTRESADNNLVTRNVASSACASRVRVIPGDAASSYIIAKLRGEPGICGQPMPRGRPSLPESEIEAISAWIDDLPH